MAASLVQLSMAFIISRIKYRDDLLTFKGRIPESYIEFLFINYKKFWSCAHLESPPLYYIPQDLGYSLPLLYCRFPDIASKNLVNTCFFRLSRLDWQLNRIYEDFHFIFYSIKQNYNTDDEQTLDICPLCIKSEFNESLYTRSVLDTFTLVRHHTRYWGVQFPEQFKFCSSCGQVPLFKILSEDQCHRELGEEIHRCRCYRRRCLQQYARFNLTQEFNSLDFLSYSEDRRRRRRYGHIRGRRRE